MTSTYSKLIYRRTEPLTLPATGTIIALHGKGGGHDDLVAFGQAISPSLRIVTPEAGRSTYFGTMVTGHTWYGGFDLNRPEPASLGESLAQLERFVYDEAQRQSQTDPDAPRPVLLGYEQGAVVALVAAEFFAVQLGGVVAIGGARPDVVRWEVPGVDASGCPVLIIHDPAEAFPSVESVNATRDHLARRGADVSVRPILGGNRADESTAAVVAAWLEARGLT